ncbi:hypothetical protein PBRA_003590 [Plasmodiophora brassicae]|nr:hypothetical protein PBRA_003590 [Plasmodiophora brassicae]
MGEPGVTGSVWGSLLLSEQIKRTEINARARVDHGLYTCKRLEGFARQISTAFSAFASDLSRICHEERTRTNKIDRDSAPGAAELWAVMLSTTTAISDLHATTAAGLVESFANPLADIRSHLDVQRKCLDALKRDKVIDVVAMENVLDKESRAALKALKSLQNAVKGMSNDVSGTAEGVFSRMARRRQEKIVNRKISEAQEMFRRHETTLETYNGLLTEFEQTVQFPLLGKIHNLDINRLTLLRECTIYLSAEISDTYLPDNEANATAVNNVLSSIDTGLAQFKAEHAGLKNSLSFVNELPCSSKAFDDHTWPGCPIQFWMIRSADDYKRRNSVAQGATTTQRPSIASCSASTCGENNTDDEHSRSGCTTSDDEDEREPAPVHAAVAFVPPVPKRRLGDDDRTPAQSPTELSSDEGTILPPLPPIPCVEEACFGVVDDADERLERPQEDEGACPDREQQSQRQRSKTSLDTTGPLISTCGARRGSLDANEDGTTCLESSRGSSTRAPPVLGRLTLGNKANDTPSDTGGDLPAPRSRRPSKASEALGSRIAMLADVLGKPSSMKPPIGGPRRMTGSTGSSSDTRPASAEKDLSHANMHRPSVSMPRRRRPTAVAIAKPMSN